MARYANHQLTLDNGAMVILPPWVSGQEIVNLDAPDVYHVDQVQLYPVGTRYHKGDRTWIYTKLGALSVGRTSYHQWVGYGLIGVNTLATVTIVTATSGENTLRGTIAGVTADMYAGGYMSLYGAAVDESERLFQILEHTLTADVPAGDVTFTLDGKLSGTYDASDGCRVMKPPWAELILPGVAGGRGSSTNFEPYLGILVAGQDINGTNAADGDFTWVQTWGPCFTAASSAHAGDTNQERNAYFMGAGDMQVADAASSYNRFWCQQAGFLLPVTCAIPGTSTTGTNLSHLDQIMFIQITR